jgi:ribosomal protein S18 acetylase RimI-like enzyme
MEVKITDNKKEIYRFLAKTPEIHLYTIGDLDDFFWPHTTWYALYDETSIQSIALLYTGMDPSTLLLFFDKDPAYSTELLKSIKPLLPARFNAHLTKGLKDLFGKENVDDLGHDHRMILRRNPELISDSNIRRLKMSDLKNIQELYDVAYPGNWFDSRMLETGKYFGYSRGSRLTGVAGIHVYSSEYRIAALGNVATHPDFRGEKIAYKLTSVLCCDLLKSTDIIGLNVKSDNKAAIKCYENIGFSITSSFDECFIRNN